MKNEVRKVYLDNLPKGGKNISNKNVNWKESVGYVVKFEYEDIFGEIEIIAYENKKLILKYKDTIFWDKPIKCGNFLNGKIGYYIGKITSDFKVNINDIFNDNNRDLIIINREYRENVGYGNNIKWYKYHCNKCGNEDWIRENSLINLKNGCNTCCSFNAKAKLGINTIWDTDRWMCGLGVSEEDAKGYTKGSGQKVTVTCPDCGKNKNIDIDRILKYKSISCVCGDKTSYPEKFTFKMLKQLNIEFISQLTNNDLGWCDKYRYDFYIPSLDMIIEVHGEQHYKETSRGRSLDEEQRNDRLKKNLALINGIKHYIIIDCRCSDLKWIKSNLINNLSSIFNLSDIDWNNCERFALSNLVKAMCDYWNIKKPNETVTDLANKFNINRNTARRYLKKGTKLGWCDYDPKEESLTTSIRSGDELRKRLSKQVEIFKDGISLGIFESCHKVEEISLIEFGIRFTHSRVSYACRNNKLYKGFEFKYIQ